ncbi:hypothetical protein GOBAR_AA11470 [Gossypium barbadense]|uniref:F-box domain-containing protein n=1 Tax=Gossypium barbadense TaxID=3634 RepID=A0A2P5Y0Q1_GOSBA|nr:hypothetical protein GOBAR_AA11470 [Gossypium barbadense]
MGASFSALFIVQDGASSSSPCLGDLPESCVASIIQHLDPPEICKLAKLNRAFSAASWADFVWESKLPPNYHILVHKILGFVPQNLGKRDIYRRLCRPNTFDGGAKKVWLHKSTGGVCMSISSKGLQITGIDDRRYWNHIPTNESRLSDSAGRHWLFGKVFLEAHELGRASRGFGRGICDPKQVHGWDIKPVRFQLWTSGDKHSTCECSLNEAGKWFHYHVGDFNVENPDSSTKIKLSMTQIDCTNTKGGLCLDSVVIYPSASRERLKHKGFLKCTKRCCHMLHSI